MDTVGGRRGEQTTCIHDSERSEGNVSGGNGRQGSCLIPVPVEHPLFNYPVTVLDEKLVTWSDRNELSVRNPLDPVEVVGVSEQPDNVGQSAHSAVSEHHTQFKVSAESGGR